MEKPEKYDDVKAFDVAYEDLPDGAFFAMADERGLDVFDFAEAQQYDDWLKEEAAKAKKEATK